MKKMGMSTVILCLTLKNGKIHDFSIKKWDFSVNIRRFDTPCSRITDN